jgi:uncharacterized repeat protein (TIGR01451 family)
VNRVITTYNGSRATFGLMWLMTGLAGAASNGDVLLLKTLDKTVASPNSKIEVTATLTNSGTNALRGFYFFDHLPSALDVTTIEVTLNGRNVTNFTVDAGQDGEVYAGCRPWRWKLETPALLAEANPIPPQGKVQLRFAISTSTSGSFSLREFGWAAAEANTTNQVFGFSQPSDQQSVAFLDQLPLVPFAIRSLFVVNNVAQLSWDSAPGQVYRVQYRDVVQPANWGNLGQDLTASGQVTVATNAIVGSAGRIYRVLRLQ